MAQSGFFSRIPPTRRRSIAESSTTKSVAIRKLLPSQSDVRGAFTTSAGKGCRSHRAAGPPSSTAHDPNGEAIAFVLASPARARKGFCLRDNFLDPGFEPGEDGGSCGQVVIAAHLFQLSSQVSGRFQSERPQDAFQRMSGTPQKCRVGSRDGGPRLFDEFWTLL